MTQVEIVRWSEGDSPSKITELLHRAYAPLAKNGLNFVAATQSAETTASRLSTAGIAWIAKRSGALVGTIAYYPNRRFESEPEFYGRPGVAHFGQLAVEPALQQQGIGAALLRVAEEHARTDGKVHLSCDTAEGAVHLIDYYKRKGFVELGRHRWPHAVYESVILSKTIA